MIQRITNWLATLDNLLHNYSWPMKDPQTHRTYQVCVDCAKRKEYKGELVA